MENARRLSQFESLNNEQIEEEKLRIIFAELLLARSLYEASEQTMLKCVLYPESSSPWRIGATPRSYDFEFGSTRAKRRKLQIEEVDAQTVNADEEMSDRDEDGFQSLDSNSVTVQASALFKSFPSCPWEKYLERFASCHIQRNNCPMGLSRALRMLQLIAAFGCPEHFVALKAAISQYRQLEPEEVLKGPENLSSHFYKVGLWSERQGLINSILQRLARAHFTSLINEGKDLIVDRYGQRGPQGVCAVTKATKAIVIKLYPRMKRWDLSPVAAEKSAFLGVQRTLRRWRQEGAIWSVIQKRFSSLALLALVPYHLQILPTARSISGSS